MTKYLYVKAHKLKPNNVSISLDSFTYPVFRKCQSDTFGLDLLLEQIFFVEEYDKGHLGEVRVVDHFVEKAKTLLHPIDIAVFFKNLVIFGQRNHEKNAIHIVETVNPLFTLRPLTTHVKHVKH